MENLKAWSYCGYVVYPADRNAYGLKWATKSYYVGWLRTETKQQMRQFIKKEISKTKK
jgi:hypothetical protein